MFGEFMGQDFGHGDYIKMVPVLFDAILGIGGEPFRTQMDVLVENIGHGTISADVRGVKKYY